MMNTISPLRVDNRDHDDHPKPPYMHIRNKPFPFQYSDCALFDLDCRAHAAEAARAVGRH